MNKKKIVVAITGASGSVYGITALRILSEAEIETHLIISDAAGIIISQELGWNKDNVFELADFCYRQLDIAAPIASGSFHTDGMIIIPCSIKTLSGVANSYAGDLIIRAADVTLKEGRPLVLVVRETPLHRGHLRLMDLAASAGAIIFPPVPAFYGNEQSLDDVIAGTVGRALLRIGIDNPKYARWKGMSRNQFT